MTVSALLTSAGFSAKKAKKRRRTGWMLPSARAARSTRPWSAGDSAQGANPRRATSSVCACVTQILQSNDGFNLRQRGCPRGRACHAMSQVQWSAKPRRRRPIRAACPPASSPVLLLDDGGGVARAFPPAGQRRSRGSVRAIFVDFKRHGRTLEVGVRGPFPAQPLFRGKFPPPRPSRRAAQFCAARFFFLSSVP